RVAVDGLGHSWRDQNKGGQAGQKRASHRLLPERFVRGWTTVERHVYHFGPTPITHFIGLYLIFYDC
ncbi:hypothetical protein ABXW85_24290, partial [Streptococcus suis]